MKISLPTVTLLAIGFVLAVSGCVNPFTPARSEAPRADETITEDFSTAEGLLVTLSESIRVRGTTGRNAYTHALADSGGTGLTAFYAFHDTTDIRIWRNENNGLVPGDWGKPQETPKFFDYLGEQQPGLAYQCLLEEDNTSESDQDTPTFSLKHRHYEISASPEDGSGEKTIIAVGYARLYMQKVGARWYLYRWEDRIDRAYGFPPTDIITMGRLRMNSYSNL